MIDNKESFMNKGVSHIVGSKLSIGSDIKSILISLFTHSVAQQIDFVSLPSPGTGHTGIH